MVQVYQVQHLQDLGARLKDIFGLTEVLQGDVPPNVEAGVAIDLLQEAAVDRLAPQIMLMEKSLERCGNQLLQLAQKYYQEPRMLIINGSGSKPKVERFEDADLIKGVQVRVEAGSGLPRTRAGRQARVLQLLQLGILSPTKAYKYLDMADFKTLQMQFEADEEQAMREHDKLMDGVAVNMNAANQAASQIMMMMQNPQVDPETGQASSLSPEVLEQSIDAGLSPLPFENSAVHLEVHSAFMKSAEFDSLPMSVQARFYKHFELTQKKVESEGVPKSDPPKVTMQLRGAVGPTTGSKILNQAGVQNVTPQELLEPALDTVVIDNKDKPNAPETQFAGVQDYQQGVIDKLIGNQALEQQKLQQRYMEKASDIG